MKMPSAIVRAKKNLLNESKARIDKDEFWLLTIATSWRRFIFSAVFTQSNIYTTNINTNLLIIFI